MENDRYVAALEVGSSKIIAAVGRTDGKGLDIVAIEQVKKCDIVRYGAIQNLEATSSAINELIDRLESRPEISPRRIQSFFVGISGRSMRGIQTESSIKFDEEKEISQEDLDALSRMARNTAIDSSLKIIDVVPRKYKVGKTHTHNPIGMIGTELSAIFDLIVCRPVLERNLERTVVEKSKVAVANFVVTPIAASHLLVLPDEKRVGCMFVDMGAETTTVLIFKNGEMVYFSTIPLGSRNITLDLMSLKLSEEKAEAIKQQSGKAIAPETRSMITIEGIRNVDIINIVVARAEEIAANICEQIHYAGLDHTDLPGGIIAMGEGFKLTDMMELLGRQCNLPIRAAKLPANGLVIEDHKAPGTDILQVASVLYSGASLTETSCLQSVSSGSLPVVDEPNDYEEEDKEKVKEKKERDRHRDREKKTKKPGIFDKLRSRVMNAITYTSDDDDQEIE
jgi:cell division protein FtsA